MDCGCGTAPAPETPAPVSAVDPTAQPVTAPVVAATVGPSTPEPTPVSPGTDRGLESSAPTPSTGLSPGGVFLSPHFLSPDTPTPPPAGTGPVAGSCGAEESFQITSSALPDVQGCYQSTNESFSNPGSLKELWTVSGTTASDQVTVIGWAEGGEKVVSQSRGDTAVAEEGCGDDGTRPIDLVGCSFEAYQCMPPCVTHSMLDSPVPWYPCLLACAAASRTRATPRTKACPFTMSVVCSGETCLNINCPVAET